MFKRRSTNITAETFAKILEESNEYCTKHSEKLELIRKYRLKALKKLQNLIKNTNPEYVEKTDAIKITWCAIALIEYFHFDISKKAIATKAQKKKDKNLDEAFNLLSSVVNVLPDYSNSMSRKILKFLTTSGLWRMEFLSAEIVKRLMTSRSQCAEVLNLVFDILEHRPFENKNMDREIIRVVSRVLYESKLEDIDIDVIHKFLKMYNSSVKTENPSYEKYSHLQSGLENCIKAIITNTSNQHILMIIEIVLECLLDNDNNGEYVYNFGTILHFSTLLHVPNVYKNTLKDKLFTNILYLIQSPNSVSSLLGHKMFQNILDRNGNVSQFEAPRIYFNEMDYDIKVNYIKSDDKDFMKTHRKELHTCMLTCVKLHGQHRGLVETIFTTLALLLVEIKCGFTAASVVCMALNIQEYVLSPEFKHQGSCSHRFHGMVISILSLVCWLFKATVFYEYLYTIMQCRAYHAPFLNPPIRYKYQYAEHNILWNKKELFFEDWQVRYGMWNCFRPVTYADNKHTLQFDKLSNIS